MLEKRFSQIEKKTIAQDIVQQLIDLIMNGSIGPGERLPPERQLMELFGVGRSSLREAIRALTVLGLVEVKVPEGTFVSKSFGDFFTKHLGIVSRISFNNIVELVEARIAFESDIAELAAKKATPKDVEKLETIIGIMKNAQNNDEFLGADLQFHICLAEISRNSFMLHVMNILREVTKEWIIRVIQARVAKQAAIKQHEKIAVAIKKNDTQLARTAMMEHLQYVSDKLFEIKKEMG